MGSLISLNNANAKKSSKQREKNREFQRREAAKKRREFNKLKEPEALYKKNILSIQESIEIRKISPNGIWQVGENLYSKSFLMHDMNYCTMSYKEALGWFDEWCRILNSFDVHLCKITIFNNNRDMVRFKNNILYQHKADNFNLQRDCYNDIITSKIMNERNGIEQVKYITITVKRNSYNDAYQSLGSIESGMVKDFASLGSSIIPLNSNQRLKVIHDFIHLDNSESINIEDSIMNGRDWRNDISCDYIDFSSDPSFFFSEKKSYKALYIEANSYPDDELSDKMFDELISKPTVGIISVDIIPINQTATKNAIEDKYMAVQNKIRVQQKNRNREGAFSSDISYPVQRENEDTKEMLDDITVNGQKMFWTGVTVVLAADSLNELDNAEDELNVAIEKYECYLTEFHYRQREALYTALPIGGRYVDEMRSMFTRMCGILIPFKCMEMSMSDNPLYYGQNKETKNLILCNRKKMMNGNGFVLSTSGAGKSTAVKFEQGGVFLNYDDDIIVLDPTGEYEEVANSFNGQFIDISPNSMNYINPLHIDIKNLSPKNIKAVITQKSTIMCGICEHAMESEFSSSHRSIVDRCIKIMYEGLLTTPIDERAVPIMSDFYKILKNQTDVEVHEITLGLEVFISGSMNIFNHPNNVDVDNRYTVFGLRDIGEELESVGMLVVLSYIRQKIISNAAKGIFTWLYVDEFHELMDKKYSKRFLVSLWKKVRKLGGICTGVTQNIGDIEFDKLSNKLLSNSEYTLILKLGNGESEPLKKAFDGILTDSNLKYCSNADFGNGLIRFGNSIIPIDNYLPKDNIIYDIFNTNFAEKVALKKSGIRNE